MPSRYTSCAPSTGLRLWGLTKKQFKVSWVLCRGCRGQHRFRPRRKAYRLGSGMELDNCILLKFRNLQRSKPHKYFTKSCITIALSQIPGIGHLNSKQAGNNKPGSPQVLESSTKSNGPWTSEFVLTVYRIFFEFQVQTATT